jgi:hypothetical protein
MEPGSDNRIHQTRLRRPRPTRMSRHLFRRLALHRLRKSRILLQAVHVIDAGTDLRKGTCITRTRPQAGQEVSGNKAKYKRDNGGQPGNSHLFTTRGRRLS